MQNSKTCLGVARGWMCGVGGIRQESKLETKTRSQRRLFKEVRLTLVWQRPHNDRFFQPGSDMTEFYFIDTL